MPDTAASTSRATEAWTLVSRRSKSRLGYGSEIWAKSVSRTVQQLVSNLSLAHPGTQQKAHEVPAAHPVCLFPVRPIQHPVLTFAIRACSCQSHAINIGSVFKSVTDYRQTLAFQLLQKFEAYRSEVEKYASIGEYCPIPCFITAHDGVSILYVNPAYEALTGCTVDEVQNGRWEKIIHPDDREAASAAWARFIADKQPVCLNQRYVNAKTGEETKVRTCVNVVKGNGFIGFMVPECKPILPD